HKPKTIIFSKPSAPKSSSPSIIAVETRRLTCTKTCPRNISVNIRYLNMCAGLSTFIKYESLFLLQNPVGISLFIDQLCLLPEITHSMAAHGRISQQIDQFVVGNCPYPGSYNRNQLGHFRQVYKVPVLQLKLPPSKIIHIF